MVRYVLGLCLLLSGCGSIPVEEIDNTPKEEILISVFDINGKRGELWQNPGGKRYTKLYLSEDNIKITRIGNWKDKE